MILLENIYVPWVVNSQKIRHMKATETIAFMLEMHTGSVLMSTMLGKMTLKSHFFWYLLTWPWIAL